MFTVKAEVWANGQTNMFDLFNTERVHVERSRPPAGFEGFPPEYEVWLGDHDCARQRCLVVGRGLDHYAVVYVMNERGKTVEIVQPSDITPSVAHEIPRAA